MNHAVWITFYSPAEQKQCREHANRAIHSNLLRMKNTGDQNGKSYLSRSIATFLSSFTSCDENAALDKC